MGIWVCFSPAGARPPRTAKEDGARTARRAPGSGPGPGRLRPPPPASLVCVPSAGRAVLTEVVSEFAFVSGGRVDLLSFFLPKVSLFSHLLGLRETNISPSPVSIQKTNPKWLGFYRKGTALHSVGGGDTSQGQTRRASARRPSGVSPDSTSVSACGRSGSVAAVGAGGLAPCCGPVRLTRREGGSNAQGHERNRKRHTDCGNTSNREAERCTPASRAPWTKPVNSWKRTPYQG